MTESEKDAGIMAVLLERFEKQRLPRALALKQKVDKGEPLDELSMLRRMLSTSDSESLVPNSLPASLRCTGSSTTRVATGIRMSSVDPTRSQASPMPGVPSALDKEVRADAGSVAQGDHGCPPQMRKESMASLGAAHQRHPGR